MNLEEVRKLGDSAFWMLFRNHEHKGTFCIICRESFNRSADIQNRPATKGRYSYKPHGTSARDGWNYGVGA